MSSVNIPRVLKNWNCFVDGIGYAGRCDEAELPEVKIKTEEHRGGGMDGSFEIDMGQETMSAKLTFTEYLPEVISALGNGKRIQLRGALRRDTDGSTVPVVVTIGGRIKGFMPGTWKAGDVVKPEHEIAVDYYRWNQAGVDVFEIDVVNMVRVMGGTDQLAQIRAAIGL